MTHTRIGIRLLILVAMVAAVFDVRAQEKVDPSRQMTSTVLGGSSTGSYNTWSPLTLRRGEIQVGLFFDNYDRDPGDLDIYRIPFNITAGMSDRWEVFANLDFFQKVRSRLPIAPNGQQVQFLSGYQLNGLGALFGGDPLRGLGPPTNTRGAAFFPGGSPPGGGILPVLGGFVGPRVLTDRPSFFNDLPFFGPVTFDRTTGRLRSSPTSNGLGNVTLGTKVRLWQLGRHHHTVSLGGILRLPTTRSFAGMASGRGAGEVDFGPLLIYGSRYADGRIRLNTNFGWIHSGDPGHDGVKFLDRRDQFIANAALEGAPNEWAVFLAEWNNLVYVGSGTPNLNPVNPMDIFVGTRVFLGRGRMQFGGGWRRFLNPSGDKTIPLSMPGLGISSFNVPSGDANGFSMSLGFGRRVERVPPPPPNRPPTVSLEADRNSVQSGGIVKFTARASDPDNDVLIYTWSTSAGRVTGSGANVSLDTRGLNDQPGAKPFDVTVGLTVDDGRGGADQASRSVAVTAPAPSPDALVNRLPRVQSVNCRVIGTPQVPGQVTDGESVRVSVVASDPDGDPLQYSYTTTAGKLSGRGNEPVLDTTGVTSGRGAQPLTITVSLTVTDGRGGSESGSCTITVQVLKPAQAERVVDLRFPRNSARVDNVMKAALDDVALRLQQDPRAISVIDGYAEKGEASSLGQRRAQNVRHYLVRDKGIDASRLTVRNFGTSADAGGGRGMNRRVVLWIVPQGAELPPGPSAQVEKPKAKAKGSVKKVKPFSKRSAGPSMRRSAARRAAHRMGERGAQADGVPPHSRRCEKMAWAS